MNLTPAQIRAARGLLNWSQAKLAEVSGVSLSTVKSFESGSRKPIPANLNAIFSSLANAGVIFIDENGEGPGVRLKKTL